jgi:Sec-independent protein translocase protein TatA
MLDLASADPGIEGAILTIGPEGVIGWGWHRGRPAEPLRIVLLIEGNPVASGFANRFDLPAVRAQVGPGAPGFALRLPQWPRNAYPLEIELRDGQGRRLGEKFSVRSAAQLAPACDGERLPLEGNFDQLKDGRLLGWAWDPNRPEAALALELLDGGEVLAGGVADLAREDLRVAGKRGGWCGFAFDLSATLIDNRPHALRVRAAGTNWEVPNGPVVFGPSRLPELFDELAQLRRDVQRLSAQMEQLTRPDSALMRDIIGSLHERTAMMAEIQRDAVEREMDALRRFHFMPIPAIPADPVVGEPSEAPPGDLPGTPPGNRAGGPDVVDLADGRNDALEVVAAQGQPIPWKAAEPATAASRPKGGSGSRLRAPRPPIPAG